MMISTLEPQVSSQGIARAIEQIAAERHSQYLAGVRRQRLESCIKTIDGMVEDLELQNLSGCKVVSNTWQSRLDRLVSSLPIEPPAHLKASGSTVHLMDALFTIQGTLLRLKASKSPEMDQADAIIEEEMTYPLSRP
jgi:hypothetical protein